MFEKYLAQTQYKFTNLHLLFVYFMLIILDIVWLVQFMVRLMNAHVCSMFSF